MDLILREDQLLEPKIQRIIKQREKEKEQAIFEAAEDFQIEEMIKKPGGKAKTKGKSKQLPVIQFGYGKTNPNIPKKNSSKKKKK